MWINKVAPFSHITCISTRLSGAYSVETHTLAISKHYNLTSVHGWPLNNSGSSKRIWSEMLKDPNTFHAHKHSLACIHTSVWQPQMARATLLPSWSLIKCEGHLPCCCVFICHIIIACVALFLFITASIWTVNLDLERWILLEVYWWQKIWESTHSVMAASCESQLKEKKFASEYIVLL